MEVEKEGEARAAYTAPNYRVRRKNSLRRSDLQDLPRRYPPLLLPNPTLIFRLWTTTLSPFVVVDVEFRDFITRYCPRFSNATHAQALLTRTWSWSRSRRSAARDLYTLSPPLLFLRCLRHSSLSAINLGSGGTIATCFFGLPEQQSLSVVGEGATVLDLGSLFTCNQKRTFMKPVVRSRDGGQNQQFDFKDNYAQD